MKSLHICLDPMLKLPELLNKDIGFISENTSDFSRYLSWIPLRLVRQVVFQQIRHIEMAYLLWKQRKRDILIIFEHHPQYSLFFYLMCVFYGKPVFLLVHGIQQICNRSIIHLAGFKLMQLFVNRYKMYPVHLELGDEILKKELRFNSLKSFTIPLSHYDNQRKLKKLKRTKATHLPRFCVVGLLREDKKTSEIVEYLLMLNEEIGGRFEFVFGTPFYQKESWVDDLGVSILDTTTNQQYQDCLISCDVLIIDGNEKDYYFRPSSVINDALTYECAVICPNYPTFREQVFQPKQVGYTYSSYRDLGTIIQEIILTKSYAKFDYSAWKKYRCIKKISERFKPYII